MELYPVTVVSHDGNKKYFDFISVVFVVFFSIRFMRKNLIQISINLISLSAIELYNLVVCMCMCVCMGAYVFFFV